MPVLQPFHEVDALPEGALPPPNLSTLPPPGDMHLHISLGKQIGRGRCGVVHAVNMPSDAGLPPLVAKIGRFGYQSRIIREASAYEEVESLQGIAAPLCYGAFEGRLPDGCRLDVDLKAMRYTEHSRRQFDSDVYWADLDRRIRDAANPERVCVLLLERLSTRGLPVGKKLSKSLRKDIFDLCEDTSALYVLNRDLRYENIRAAGPSTAAAICPRHKYAHKWRVIDLEMAEKYAAVPYNFHSHDGRRSFLDDVFDALEEGEIIYPRVEAA
ncbi:hypothetical protein PLICRDRAFT_33325 [Plicaturopsis crispa FD-325 SS-3]|nr:hypothetical protein PLICRDRAFT_33325 [Plicaturopsis crispa FD-325 SS-3]